MRDRRIVEKIEHGMIVRSADGEKLGRVLVVTDIELQIEKGLFFPKDYLVSLDDILNVDEGEVVLRTGRDALRVPGERAEEIETERASAPVDTPIAASPAMPITPAVPHVAAAVPVVDAPAPPPPSAASAAPEPGPAAARADADRDDVRMRLAEEQIDVAKREREVGAVRLRKEVVEETKVIEVPVRKEQVRVEHVAVASDAAPATGAFEEDEIVVPVREEEVEVRKRAVTTGEVRLRKEETHEEQRVAEPVRREEAHVETEGEVRHVEGPAPYDDPDKRY